MNKFIRGGFWAELTCPCEFWRDDFEEFGPDRWAEADPAWAAPELDLGDGRCLILDAPAPFAEEEWAVSGAN